MRSYDSRPHRAPFIAFGALLLAAAAPAAFAQPPAPAGGEAVVVQVGREEITVAELEQRMRKVPLYQLRVLGKTPEAVRRAYLEHLVSQELLVLGARAEKLDQRADVQGRLRAVLRSAILASLRAEAGDGTTVTKEEIAAYYEENQDKYRGRKLLKLWQLVVSSREQAEQLLEHIRSDADYQQDPVKGWGELVAKHSLDEQTKQRKGNLDFVRADGSTKRPDLKVHPALYAAADKVADGEVVPEPVQVGKAWVIVQRRGTRQTPERTLDNEAPAIRRRMAQVKYEKSVRELRDKLRKKYVAESHPELVDRLEVTAPQGDIVQVNRPGGLPRKRHPAAGTPRPSGPPGHLR